MRGSKYRAALGAVLERLKYRRLEIYTSRENVSRVSPPPKYEQFKILRRRTVVKFIFAGLFKLLGS